MVPRGGIERGRPGHRHRRPSGALGGLQVIKKPALGWFLEFGNGAQGRNRTGPPRSPTQAPIGRPRWIAGNKKPALGWFLEFGNGAQGRNRTGPPRSPTQAPIGRPRWIAGNKKPALGWFLEFGNGAQGRNRTTDTGIFSPLLYRLSYLGNGALLNPFQRLESILTEDYFCGGT